MGAYAKTESVQGMYEIQHPIFDNGVNVLVFTFHMKGGNIYSYFLEGIMTYL
jgi:hypothetical protein